MMSTKANIFRRVTKAQDNETNRYSIKFKVVNRFLVIKQAANHSPIGQEVLNSKYPLTNFNNIIVAMMPGGQMSAVRPNATTNTDCLPAKVVAQWIVGGT